MKASPENVGLSLLWLAMTAPPSVAQAHRSPTPAPISGGVCVTTIAAGIIHGWAIELLPGGDIILTEREGRLKRFTPAGIGIDIQGVPAVDDRGRGGLLDVALAPDFETSRRIYLAFAEPSPAGARLAVMQARLNGDSLREAEVIYRTPSAIATVLYGARMAFMRDGRLLVTVGDRSLSAEAQSKHTPFGKILVLNRSGPMGTDTKTGATLASLWSLGHRNPIALAIDPITDDVWIVDHGEAGGDELNRVLQGRNYGWPQIGYGVTYGGQRVGSGFAKAGMEQPMYYWDPVIAPSALLIYRGDKASHWRSNLLITGLRSRVLIRLVHRDGVVITEERYLAELGERLRDIKEDDDGRLVILTDGPEGRLLLVTPPHHKVQCAN